MKQTALILIIFLSSLSSCNKNSNYKPEGLRKLSGAEIIDRVKAKNFVSDGAVFKDSLGNTISIEEVRELNQEEFFGDQYVDSRNDVVEVVVRKATNHDKELIQKIKEAFEEGEPITIIDIDCSKV